MLLAYLHSSLSGLLLLLLLLPRALVSGDLACQPVSGCKCQGSGFQLDISGLFSYPKMISGGGQSFSFSPCDGTQCNGVAAVCQIFSATLQSSCGKTTSSVWSVSSLNPPTFAVAYYDGDVVTTSNKNRYSVVTFTSTQDQNLVINFIAYGGSATPYYNFTVQGKSVEATLVLGASDIRGVVGIVLIFISIGSLAAYFIGGCVFQYFHKGARGQEIIPHVAFWKDLPFLIKDGILFTIQPCYRRNYEKC